MLNDAPNSLSRSVEGAAVGQKGPASIISEKLRREGGAGYWLREGEAAVRFSSFSGSCQVVLLSPSIAWVEPDEHADHPFGEPIDVWLSVGEREIGPFPATIMLQAMMGRRGPFLALTFEQAPPAIADEVSALLRELDAAGAVRPAHAAELWDVQSTRWARAHEVIDRPDRVRAILAGMTGRRGIARRMGGGSPHCVQLSEVEGDHALWSTDESWGDASVRIDMFGYNSVYRVHLDALEERDGRVITRLPARVERIRQRLLRRGIVRSALTVTYGHPLWPDVPAKAREVRDVSFKGISFTVSADDDLIYPGLTLPFVEVSDGQGTTVRLTAVVRAVTPDTGEEGEGTHLCALSVSPSTPEDDRRWTRLVAGALYLTTRSAPDWTRALWDLFESSGYFSLSGKSAEQFTQLKASFMSVGKRAAALPHLFCQAVWVSRRGVEATVSVLKAYEGTWLGHQLAKRGGPPHGADPRTILRDIYFRGLEHPLTDPKFEWMLGYTESSVSWMNRSHVAFAERHAPSGESLALPFRLMEVSCAQSFGGSASGLDVGAPDEAELEFVVQQIARMRPRCYVQTLNLSAERILLKDNIDEWRAAGLERERGLLVARRGGVPVAAAIMETGEPGTNLFRLLDGIRLFPLDAEGPAGIDAFGALLDGARHWYLERGRPLFVYYREYESPSLDSQLCDLGEGRVWVISARLLPEFLEFVYQLTMPKR